MVTQAEHTGREVVTQTTGATMVFTEKLIAVALPNRLLGRELTDRAIGCSLRSRTGVGWWPEKVTVMRACPIEPRDIVSFFREIDPAELLGWKKRSGVSRRDFCLP